MKLVSTHCHSLVICTKHQRCFDMAPSKSITKTVVRECKVCSSGKEKKHLTVVFTTTASGQILLPMVILYRKTAQTTRYLNTPTSFIIKTQVKMCMNDNLIKILSWKKLFQHAHAECKWLVFENSLLIFDVFCHALNWWVEKSVTRGEHQYLSYTTWLNL